MDTGKKRLEHVLEKLRARGYRITPQRLAVVKILAVSEGHPSVEDIYEQVRLHFPTTSLATVYKTIAVVKELGEVLELEFSSEHNRYDGRHPFPHPHLICLRCRRIVDPELNGLEQLTDELCAGSGYQIVRHRLDFFGICLECQKIA
ncbi:MAG: transcriptional repressor [Desulfobulbaceae bacterium A2]|nr:MAG: transcriptional repressor [Desulfobulbaceae bacterium A2]